MKTILCYGDSNTYGYNPSNGFRYPEGIRWTCRLAKLLGEEYRVIEEGCNGRTTVYDDPIDGWKNGLDYLRPCLNSHKPVDIVVLMLGSNDLKEVFHASAQEIADGAGTLVKVIKAFTEEKQGFIPKIILISPPEIGEDIAHSAFYGRFREDAVPRSREFAGYYEEIAHQYDCIFLDAAAVIKPSPIDSLHLSPEAHEKLAKELSEIITVL
ncbi:MAG: SGNH/GDSL hydrolase family protein [Lachnospiraceae bacterium]|nr:SGNH/GDSL hydrolase family protein [Lachnospiraceae bacterium]